MMNKRENILRAVRFERPDYIPMVFHINAACWQHYPHDALFDLIGSHKFLFPDFKGSAKDFTPSFASIAQKDEPFTDDWGCLWETTEDGITGTVTHHPIADWSAFETYSAPDPEVCMGIGPIDWKQVAIDINRAKKRRELLRGGLRHGHTFIQL